jgi:hypothetical protein
LIAATRRVDSEGARRMQALEAAHGPLAVNVASSTVQIHLESPTRLAFAH